MTEARAAQLQAATIGQPTRADGPIFLSEYDPGWPMLYEREATRVLSILGDRVLQLEHVGSTSVPGLPAKPIVDMLLVFADSADEPAYVASMESAGYALRIREPEWYEHRLFKGPDTDINLHTFSNGSSEIARMLAFRDRLRTHDDERERYLQTKRELAACHWVYVQDYADAKGEVVEGIIARAMAEAAGTRSR